ncbi:hypothetical protein JTE90_021748 [Oedothorax gibbosus]|uniref:Cystatin domain-containing protein n=1 Tax=Oedothorax gibbosus TaxID=931172 RepID=A0AAV6UEF4_9ARAC|nr:hypothetical protein JTE90_021748 [Oedothorax gibbosus]
MLKIAFLLSAVALCGLAALLPGGYTEVEVDNESVVLASREGARALSQKMNSKYHHTLIKVTKAEKQVVAGLNFRMDIVVGETNCKKAEVSYDKLDNCEFLDGPTTYKKCQVIVFQDLVQKHHLTYSGCIAISKKDI